MDRNKNNNYFYFDQEQTLHVIRERKTGFVFFFEITKERADENRHYLSWKNIPESQLIVVDAEKLLTHSDSIVRSFAKNFLKELV